MAKKNKNRILASVMAAACTLSALPMYSAWAADEAEGTIIYATDFEDGKIEHFTGRGGVEVIEASTELACNGDYAMCVSGREESWNGPQFSLSDNCEPNTEYLISANVKSQWYSNVNLSMEYTDTEGERHYSNLKSVGGDQWVSFEDVKVSFTEDMTNVYIYFECSDTCNLYVDDFKLSTAPVIPIEEDLPDLNRLYSPYFKIGTAIMASNLSSPSFMDLVEKHFSDSMTFGNELKPDFVLNQEACLAYMEENDGDDTNPQISLAAAASMLKYCAKNNIPVRGHTLVWHSQTPDWFFKEGYSNDGDWVSKEKMLLRMENYIKNVMEALETQYPDVEFYAWDVVNEAWMEDGKPRTAGSNNVQNGASAWVQIFGDNSFIEYAFTYARKYAPEGCKLYYNDYNEYMDGKMNAIYEMALELKEKNLIDGIGMQAHLDVGFPTAAQFERAVEKYVSTGLDVQVTELDITTNDTSAAGLEKQAQMYSDIMDACVKYADGISAVVFWGVTDDQSWRADRVPLLFDGTFQSKPAFAAITDGLEMPPTEEPSTTEPTTEAPSTDEPTTDKPADAAYGDVNEDGEVNILDVLTLNRNLLIGEALSDQAKVNADVDLDGKPSSVDALNILKFTIKLVTEFPITATE